jgi:hypothetical protein
VFLFANFAGTAYADQSVEATLLSLEQTWIDASKSNDVNTLKDIIDDRYRAITPTGEQTKADMLRPTASGITQTLQNMKVHVQKNAATVSGENVVVRADGKILRLAFTDQFVEEGGKWRVVQSWVTQP